MVGKWRQAVVKQEGVRGRKGEWEKEGRKTQDTGRRESRNGRVREWEKGRKTV